MTVIKNVRKGFYLKGRPSAYKASDAAYVTGGNRGFVLSALPSAYPRTAPQKRVAGVAAECGIRKGISKAALQKAMVECVGPKMRK
jgi:hypothetical protein